MAQTLCFVVLLSMLMCFASGNNFSIQCPDKMKRATHLYQKSINITCKLNKVAFTDACGGSLPSQVQFDLTNTAGSKLQWCYTKTSPCPNTGTVTTTGSPLPSSCGCVDDDGTTLTFNMTIFPTFDIDDRTFTCEAGCLTTGPLPKLVDVDNHCTNIQIVDPCGGCPPGEGCDERELKCYPDRYTLFLVFCVLFVISFCYCTIAAIFTFWYFKIRSPPTPVPPKPNDPDGGTKPNDSRPMPKNKVVPEEETSEHLSTSQKRTRELPTPNAAQATRLDPLYPKTNVPADEMNSTSLSSPKLAPIPTGKSV